MSLEDAGLTPGCNLKRGDIVGLLLLVIEKLPNEPEGTGKDSDQCSNGHPFEYVGEVSVVEYPT
jgi:hypothetical protein